MTSCKLFNELQSYFNSIIVALCIARKSIAFSTCSKLQVETSLEDQAMLQGVVELVGYLDTRSDGTLLYLMMTLLKSCCT